MNPVALLLLCLIGALNGCTSVFNQWAFREEIPQGSVFETSQIMNLKPGLSKTQVVDQLGTPTLLDPFHTDRWHYLYRLTAVDGQVTQRQATLFFTPAGVLQKVVF